MESRNHSHSADVQSLDTLFGLLSDRRRRYVVELLSGRESPVALDELAAAVAARETDAESDDVSEETTGTVGATLHHVHLPKLDDTDIVDYDAESKEVRFTRTEVLAPFSGLLDDSE